MSLTVCVAEVDLQPAYVSCLCPPGCIAFGCDCEVFVLPLCDHFGRDSSCYFSAASRGVIAARRLAPVPPRCCFCRPSIRPPIRLPRRPPCSPVRRPAGAELTRGRTDRHAAAAVKVTRQAGGVVVLRSVLCCYAVISAIFAFVAESGTMMS